MAADIRSQVTNYLVTNGGTPHSYGDIRGNLYAILESQDPVTKTSVVRIRLRIHYHAGSSGTNKSMSTRATGNSTRFYAAEGGAGTYSGWTSFNSRNLTAGAYADVVNTLVTIYHKADGTATLHASAQFNFNITQRYTISPEGTPQDYVKVYSGQRNCSFSVVLPTIPLPGSITTFNTSAGATSIGVSWAYNKSYNAIQYSIGSGWVGTSGTSFTISGLTANTTYNVTIRVQDSATGIWVQSSTKSVKTLGYAAITSFTATTTSMSDIQVAFAVDKAINQVQYDTGSGWVTRATTGSPFTIGNLTPNTTYSVKIRVRASDSNLYTESSAKSVTTKDWARLTSTPSSVNVENSILAKWNRNGGNTLHISIQNEASTKIEWAYESVTGSEYTISLNQSEKDHFYSDMKSVSSKKYTIVLRTTVAPDYFKYSINPFTFTVTNANPTFDNFTYADINSTTLALTGNNQTIIKGFSNVRATVSEANKALGNKGADIVKYRFVVDSNQVEKNYAESGSVTLDINAVQSNQFYVYAIDTRNNSEYKLLTPSRYIDYVAPKITSLSIDREDGIGEKVVVDFRGTYHNENFGLIDNAYIAEYRYRETTQGSWSLWNPISLSRSGNNLTYLGYINGDLGGNGFNVLNSYNIEFRLKDSLSTIQTSAILNSGTPNLAIHKDGVAIGKAYDTTQGGALQVAGKGFANQFEIKNMLGGTDAGLKLIRGDHAYNLNMSSNDLKLFKEGNTNNSGMVFRDTGQFGFGKIPVSTYQIDSAGPINATDYYIAGLLMSDTVIDTGITNFGTYIKFTNGMMISIRAVALKFNVSTTWSNMYVGQDTTDWNFALPFIAPPPIAFWVPRMKSNVSFYPICYTAPQITATYYKNISIGRPSQSNEAEFDAIIIAVGRWKT